MNLQRVGLVARQDLRDVPRRPLYLFGAAVMALNGWMMSRGGWIFRSVDTSLGTPASWNDSEFQIAYVFGLIGFFLFSFFVALAGGLPLIRDRRLRVGEILHATPLTTAEYALGRFLGVLGGVFFMVASLLAALYLFCHVFPDGTRPDMYGPFALRAYLLPTVVFLLPGMIFLTGLSLALGAWTGQAIVVFLVPVAGWFFHQNFWGWFPPSLSDGTMRFLQLADPSGFRWLKQNWLMTDRGITFYNTEAISYDVDFLLSRLVFTALGFCCVALTVARLERTERGRLRRRERGLKPSTSSTNAAFDERFQPPLSVLRMSVSVPSSWRAAATVARFEMRELFSQPGLYIFIPLVAGTIWMGLDAAGGNTGFNTPPQLITSGMAAFLTHQWLCVWAGALTLFYVGASLDREKSTRIADVFHASPVPDAAILAGKSLANLVVLATIFAAAFVSAAAIVASQPETGGHRVPFEIAPFLIVWGGISLPTALLWLAFVTAVHSLLRNRLAVYGVGIAAIILTGRHFVLGEMTWLTNWPFLALSSWSDLSIFELDRRALVLNRLLVLSSAMCLAVFAVFLRRRRDRDAMTRFKPSRVQIARAACLLAVPIGFAFLLRHEVHSSYDGDAARAYYEKYRRLNLMTFGHGSVAETLPALRHVDLEIDFEPAERSFTVSGFYDVINATDRPMPWMPVGIGRQWQDLEWTLDGRIATPEDRTGLHLFRFDEPLAPEATMRLGFEYRGVYPFGSSRVGFAPMEHVLPSSIVLTGRNPEFVPVIGFDQDRGVDEDNRTARRDYPPGFHEGVTAGDSDRSAFTHRLKITAPSELTVNSTGVLRGKTAQGDRTEWIWESDYPLRVFNVIAGEWEVERGEQTAVFYDARHPYNVEAIRDTLDASMEHFSQWFHPYPWQELRLSEFPAIATYGRGNATNIFFSEGVGFLTRQDPEMDQAFLITAHEAAHSWWGHIVSHGAGPGGIVLSEGGAQFSVVLLLQEERGDFQRMRFLRDIEAAYAEFRLPSREKPLAEAFLEEGFADSMVIYNRGAWTFWMLLDHMGREAFLSGVQEFFREYHHNPDHPVLHDFLRALRPYAPDAEAYDAFTKQWFLTAAIPEFRVETAEKSSFADGWSVTAEIENAGGASMPVDVTAISGRRFESDGSESPEYRECRGTFDFAPQERETITLHCDFEPERIVVDPDVMVMQLQRRGASKDIEER